MEMQEKKRNNLIAFGIVAAALLLLAAFAYAQEANRNMPNKDMMDMMGGQGMQAMHDQMTRNLDPETKKEMDEMHEQCGRMHDNGKSGKGMMG